MFKLGAVDYQVMYTLALTLCLLCIVVYIYSLTLTQCANSMNVACTYESVVDTVYHQLTLSV